jgi:hypothetical protein
MNSREIVRRTLDYEQPSRVARSFRGSDFVWTSHKAPTPQTDWQKVDERRWRRIDEWGNIWGRIDTTSKGQVLKGVLDDLDDLDGHEFPDFSRPADYQSVRDARAEHPDKWIIGAVPGFAFNIARKLRKLDQYLIDLVAEPEKIHQLHDRIDVLLEDMIRNYASAGADCIMFPEDWGTQTQLFINPSMWRQECMPRFVKLCSIAHECGIRVFMHSCGKIGAIVPDLIQAGVDVLQFDQPELHGIDTLASHQKLGKITFWCPVDIQKTLQTKSEQLIRAQARELLDKLWRGRGGFIAGYYTDNIAIGIEPQWQEFACDEFISCGVRGAYE